MPHIMQYIKHCFSCVWNITLIRRLISFPEICIKIFAYVAFSNIFSVQWYIMLCWNMVRNKTY